MASIWPSTISTARKSNNDGPAGGPKHALLRPAGRHRVVRRSAWALLGLACTAAVWAQPAVACPFCTALKPSLAQLREQAETVALAEVVAVDPAAKRSDLRIHRVLKGAARLGGTTTLSTELDIAARTGGLIVLFGEKADAGPANGWSWRAVGVNETSFAYFARSPSLKTPTHERLQYFAAYLEHADPLLAEDAYLEFGHAPFDEVARVSELLPGDKLRDWLVDPRVPEARKGFYGLAIALAAPEAERATTAEFLRKLILAPSDDFRAGFDGVLGGYLLLAGESGLELIEARYLANPQAADGDVRHALTALRFYHEYGHGVPPARLAQALARLLSRSEFAEAAITDLARWQAWHALDRVVAVYGQGSSSEAARRAVVGYLLTCPLERARQELDRLRADDPQGVAAAEAVLSRTSSVPASQ
jgi:hypothetical protein